MRQAKGLTVIELMVVLAVLGILFSAALPGFSDLIRREKVTTAANTVLTDIQYTRQVAVTRGHPAIICPSADQQNCSGNSDWTGGWIVFVDENGNGSRDSGEELLKVGQNLASNGISTTPGRPRIRFKPDGSAGGSNATLTLCDQEGEHSRAIIISNPGRARVSDSGPGGRGLEC